MCTHKLLKILVLSAVGLMFSSSVCAQSVFRSVLEQISEPASALEGQRAYLSLGLALGSNLGVNQELFNGALPPLTLSYDRVLGKNFTAGLMLEGQNWRSSTLGAWCHYYTGSIRSAFHFDTGSPSWDPYLGLNVTMRFVGLYQGDYSEWNQRLSLNPVLGLRYFPTDQYGAFVEFSSDGVGKVSLGGIVKILP